MVANEGGPTLIASAGSRLLGSEVPAESAGIPTRSFTSSSQQCTPHPRSDFPEPSAGQPRASREGGVAVFVVAPVEEPSETHKIQSHRVSCSPGPHSALLVERELLPKMRFSAISAVRAKNNNRIWGEQSLQFTKGLRSFGRTLFSLGKRGHFSDVQ